MRSTAIWAPLSMASSGAVKPPEARLADAAASCCTAAAVEGAVFHRSAVRKLACPVLDALEDLIDGDDGGLGPLMKTVAPMWFAQVKPDHAAGAPTDPEARTQQRLKRELVAFLAESCSHGFRVAV